MKKLVYKIKNMVKNIFNKNTKSTYIFIVSPHI